MLSLRASAATAYNLYKKYCPCESSKISKIFTPIYFIQHQYNKDKIVKQVATALCSLLVS